jgi:hypothetical protein
VTPGRRRSSCRWSMRNSGGWPHGNSPTNPRARLSWRQRDERRDYLAALRSPGRRPHDLVRVNGAGGSCVDAWRPGPGDAESRCGIPAKESRDRPFDRLRAGWTTAGSETSPEFWRTVEHPMHNKLSLLWSVLKLPGNPSQQSFFGLVRSLANFVGWCYSRIGRNILQHHAGERDLAL